MFVLHNLPNSICSQKVRLALAEKGLDYESRTVDLSRFEHLTPEYLSLNPNGVIPTLVHDGQAIVESTVICEYLDEIAPDPPLSPPDALGRARMRAWLRFIDEVPSMAVRVPSFNDVLLPGYRALDREAFEGHLRRMTVRKSFFRRMGQDGFSPEEYGDALDQLRLTLERMTTAIDETGGPFLMGAQLTVADLCLAPVVQRMADLGLLSGEVAKVPLAWLGRLKARPSWAAAYGANAYFPKVERA